MTKAEQFKDVFGVKPSELAIKKLNEFIDYYEQLDLDSGSEEDDKTNEADCLDAFIYAVNAIETNDKLEEAIENIKADLAKTFWCDDDARIKAEEVVDKYTKELL